MRQSVRESRRETKNSEIFSPGRGSPKRKRLRENEKNQDRSAVRKGNSNTELQNKPKKSHTVRNASKNEYS